jgi:hypothetical protein
MNAVHRTQGENTPWEEPDGDGSSRAALDQLLAEWTQPLSAGATAPTLCPGCGRGAGDHAPRCQFAWLRLPAIPDTTRKGLSIG